MAYKPDDAGDTFWSGVFVAVFYGALAVILTWALIRHLRHRAAFRMQRGDRPVGAKRRTKRPVRPEAPAWDEATDERERSAG